MLVKKVQVGKEDQIHFEIKGLKIAKLYIGYGNRKHIKHNPIFFPKSNLDI